MSWLMAQVYDRFMRRSEMGGLAAWRADLLAGLRGRVLEIGAGTGINLPFYPRTVHDLVLAEPETYMRSRLAVRVAQAGRREIRVLSHGIETLGSGLGTFDAIVTTLVLCSVPDPHLALARCGALLRPGGRLFFLEHVGAARGSSRRRWQRRLEPAWRHVAGNCHLTRPAETLLRESGFELESVRREPMPAAVPWLHDTIRGTARYRTH